MQTYTFDVTQNSNFTVLINAKNSDGTYINLSGYGVTGVVKFLYSNTGVLFNLSSRIDSSYISGLVNVSGDVGTGVPAGQYPYNVRIFQTGNAYTLNILGGYFNVTPSVI